MIDAGAMNVLERTLRGEQADGVPAAPLYMSLFCEPIRRRKLAEVYRQMAGGKSHMRLSIEDEMEAHLEAWDRTWQVFDDPPDWMPCRWWVSPGTHDGSQVELGDGSCLWHSAGGAGSTDYEAAYDASATSSVDVWDREITITDDSDIDALVPSVSSESWMTDPAREMVARSQGRWGERFLLTGAMGTPFWGGYQVLGFAGLMRMVREGPELLGKVFGRITANRIAAIRAMHSSGLRCLFIEECLTGADMISERDFAALVWPYLRDMLAAAADIGMLTVFYFCGQIEGRLQYLAQSAAHALAFEENKKRIVIDLAEIRGEIGPEKVLFGNLDVVYLRDESRQAIYADISAQAQAAGKPFVASTGSPVTLDTPPERVSWIAGAARHL